MATLLVLVDFDNVDTALRSAGPVALAKALLSLVSAPTLGRHDAVHVRLYGGWRSRGALTNSAQRLVPDIRASSPTNFAFEDSGARQNVRVIVELADKPLGGSAMLEETFVKDRTLRKFRSRNQPWNHCLGSNCGLSKFSGLSSEDSCLAQDCGVRIGDILVRDEQKMVDTLMVADIAKAALVDKCQDIVIVSSDTDMWPGLMLALSAGCYVTHIHTRQGSSTQRHLLRTIEGPLARFYHPASP